MWDTKKCPRSRCTGTMREGIIMATEVPKGRVCFGITIAKSIHLEKCEKCDTCGHSVFKRK